MTNPEREHMLKQNAEMSRKDYREKARQLFPYITVTEHAHVQQSLDKDGAFVECTVWVPSVPPEIENIDGSHTSETSEADPAEKI